MMLNDKEQREMYNAILRIETTCKNQCRKIDDHSNRLRGLEQFKWLTVGIMTVVSAVAGWVFK